MEIQSTLECHNVAADPNHTFQLHIKITHSNHDLIRLIFAYLLSTSKTIVATCIYIKVSQQSKTCFYHTITESQTLSSHILNYIWVSSIYSYGITQIQMLVLHHIVSLLVFFTLTIDLFHH